MKDKEHKHRLIAYCWRSGQIELGQALPEGAISIAAGKPASISKIIQDIARHAYRGRGLLVAGVPECLDDDSAMAALEQFSLRVRSRLSKLQEAA
jgi:hypothetical protein